MRPTFLSALLAAATLLVGTGLADHCPNDAEPTLTVVTPEGTYYVVNDECPSDGCLVSVWIYEESNGHPGLQRGDGTIEDEPEYDPECEPDTIVF